MTGFIKKNSSPFADALRREAEGLAFLRERLQQSPVRVPDVYRVDDSRLEMSPIAAAPWTGHGWRRLGSGLAELHRTREPQFGLPADNYIGLNPQRNGLADDWGRFFVEQRLGFQVSLVEDIEIRERFQSTLEARGELLADYLDTHCSHPAPVHGDLWNGNVMHDRRGDVWLIDPAVYCGDREVDIAMTEMFGGFPAVFYRAYGEVLPLSDTYPVKREIYNLYHYLNHYNLFGAGYLSGCRRGFDVIRGL